MISRIEGEVVAAGDGAVELRCGPLTYRLLVPAGDDERLAEEVGRRLEFHVLHYLESQAQGASLVPRLIGFRTAEARAFFELFTTVRGLGPRKALRALRLPFTEVARAIAARNVAVLTTLPEIGRRTAETIVAELHERMDRFAGAGAGAETKPARPGFVRDALAALTEIGETRQEAQRLLDRVLAERPDLDSADALVAAAYRVRADVTE